jgi:hypothetical protein
MERLQEEYKRWAQTDTHRAVAQANAGRATAVDDFDQYLCEPNAAKLQHLQDAQACRELAGVLKRHEDYHHDVCVARFYPDRHELRRTSEPIDAQMTSKWVTYNTPSSYAREEAAAYRGDLAVLKALIDKLTRDSECDQASSWAGSVTCEVKISGSGYQHQETQHWEIGGADSSGLHPSQWRTTGGGSALKKTPGQTWSAKWKTDGHGTGQFAFETNPVDETLVIRRVNEQLRDKNGVKGEEVLTIGTKQKPPTPVAEEAFERQFPKLTTTLSKSKLSASYVTDGVHGGPKEVSGTTGTMSCRWDFAPQ